MATRKRTSNAAEMRAQQPVPIQPVPRPILCNPYDEPSKHWRYDTATGAATETPGRREASYWYRSERTSSGQLSLLAQEESDPLVNALRTDVRRWRDLRYEGALRDAWYRRPALPGMAMRWGARRGVTH